MSGGGCSSCGTATEQNCGSATASCCPPAPAKPSKLSLKPLLDVEPFEGTEKYPAGLMVGLDIGSTTVKAVVIEPRTDKILWKDYQRHETKQPEKCLEFLRQIEQAFPDVPRRGYRVFITGSGGAAAGRFFNACFVQEVNAVSLAVEKLYPEVESVVELGGQDAKIIVFKTEEESGRKKKIPSMNDKCAGGTGAVIDKINAKLKIPADELCNMGYVGHKLHPVAGKCGVFAETDINGLQKQGVPPEELMASLFESIVMQNLSVLTRGHTLRPTVLLLGGPNTYIRGMVECWRHNIPVVWQERNVAIPEDKAPSELVVVPENAQYFAALGAVEYGKHEIEDEPQLGVYGGADQLEWYIKTGRLEEKRVAGSQGIVKTKEELDAFLAHYASPSWEPPHLDSSETLDVFLGVDGGSTSTKAVLCDQNRKIIAIAYQLSKGNPIEDTQEVLAELWNQVSDRGCRLNILGVGTTGYAKDVLKDVIGADVALVETVAHTEAGLHYYPHADVICDVGGQDIKIIILKNGAVKDFKLNTQCSAGNGYYLQSTAQTFGIDVTEYADAAFAAEAMPTFGYGCAVFMQSDIVDFQRQGWQAGEILAGLASVLPKNIWLYVSQIPNLAKLGKTFILQGGTQRNLAAVKAQVDFISSRFHGSAERPEIIVHRHCGESGAIGCAFEAQRLYQEKDLRTSFIGFEAVQNISFRTTRDENTRCYFCKNKCLRTFIDVKTQVTRKEEISLQVNDVQLDGGDRQPSRMKHGPAVEDAKKASTASKVPLNQGEERIIIATCEKGTVEDVNDMRQIKKGMDAVKGANPNFVEIWAREAFKPPAVDDVADALPSIPRLALPAVRRAAARRRAAMENRALVRIGLPRVLNMYSQAPFFLAYFQSLGVPADNLVWSDYTTEELYKEGAKRGSIDPCFPSKVGIPHVHNLLHHKHTEKKPLTHIFFPMVESFPTWLSHVQASTACPTVVATAEAVHAAFIKEGDMFAQRGIAFKKTFLNLDNAPLTARQMHEDWTEDLGMSEQESLRATQQGMDAMARFYQDRRAESRAVLEQLESEQRLGVVLLARPYHNDPGVNHEILAEFQKLGYPVFFQDSLPIDEDILERLFGEEVSAGTIPSATSISDVWKNSYSENSSRKIWAAKYVARHPNLVALELSSFKCGHDAPIYTVVEEIIENSGTPYFYFKDIDENKPSGAIRIRTETIAYFLQRYRERKADESAKLAGIEERLAAYEQRLREGAGDTDESAFAVA